ncbi:MAG: hypothetical protein FWD58_01385 [Firmicutes bacterium]|nr:hypothetical protein [Bacillota bacterium]
MEEKKIDPKARRLLVCGMGINIAASIVGVCICAPIAVFMLVGVNYGASADVVTWVILAIIFPSPLLLCSIIFIYEAIVDIRCLAIIIWHENEIFKEASEFHSFRTLFQNIIFFVMFVGFSFMYVPFKVMSALWVLVYITARLAIIARFSVNVLANVARVKQRRFEESPPDTK